MVGCSCGDNNSNENNDKNVVENKGDTNTNSNDSANENNSSSGAGNIELRSHDFGESEEDITDLEENGIYKKEGTNLTLPDDFPSDFPIAEGMSVDVVRIGEPEVLWEIIQKFG